LKQQAIWVMDTEIISSSIHGYSYSTLYGHLFRLKAKRGQRVKRGEVIGYVGNTGKSTGPHFALRSIERQETFGSDLFLLYRPYSGAIPTNLEVGRLQKSVV